jgi:multicomponent Na+:H+ antiporter subunit D
LWAGFGWARSTAARTFGDRTGYLADVEQLPAPALLQPVPHAAWTTSGVLLGLLSTALAVALAAATVWRPDRIWSPARTLRALAVLGDRRLVLPLRRLHSGLLGDYVTWLTVGLAVLLVAVAAQM